MASSHGGGASVPSLWQPYTGGIGEENGGQEGGTNISTILSRKQEYLNLGEGNSSPYLHRSGVRVYGTRPMVHYTLTPTLVLRLL